MELSAVSRSPKASLANGLEKEVSIGWVFTGPDHPLTACGSAVLVHTAPIMPVTEVARLGLPHLPLWLTTPGKRRDDKSPH